jgi:hypothetical protein
MPRKLSRSRSSGRALKHHFSYLLYFQVFKIFFISGKKKKKTKDFFSFEIHYEILLIALVDLTL